MAVRKKKSVGPVYAVGALWILWALFGRMYRLVDFILLIALSVAVYCVTRAFLWKDRIIEVPDPEPEPEPLTEEEKALLELKDQRDKALSEMRRLNEAIQDPTVSAQIDHLEEVGGKIFDVVAEDPSKRPQIRRFLDYYLPTTLKILNAYDRMGSTGISGANIDGVKGKIETMMGVVTDAFDRQLDSLFGAEAMDIAAEITVMENLMAQEGLSEQKPFGI